MFDFGKKGGEERKPEVVGSVDRTIAARAPVPLRTVAEPVRASTTVSDSIHEQVLTKIEPAVAVQLTRDELAIRVQQMVAKIAGDQRLPLNQREQEMLATQIVDEMVGLGPLEPLLRDNTVADILVNGPLMIYVERRGKLELTRFKFRSDAHVLHVAQRIASSIGRRIDG